MAADDLIRFAASGKAGRADVIAKARAGQHVGSTHHEWLGVREGRWKNLSHTNRCVLRGFATTNIGVDDVVK